MLRIVDACDYCCYEIIGNYMSHNTVFLFRGINLKSREQMIIFLFPVLHVTPFFFFNYVSVVKIILVFNKKISLTYFLIQPIHRYEISAHLWLVLEYCIG